MSKVFMLHSVFQMMRDLDCATIKTVYELVLALTGPKKVHKA